MTRLFALLSFPCLASTRALAQGCASCYTTAASGGPQTAHALRSGIVLLLVPPLVLFAAIVFALRRWHNHNANEILIGADERTPQ